MDNGGIFFFFSLRERQRIREIRSNVVEKEREREGERKIKKNGMLLFHPIATFVVSLAERRHAIKLSVDET